MKRLLFFIILITIFGSCNSPKKSHWKVIWSGFTYKLNEETNDTINYPNLFLANYIEINDSGKVKLMIRKYPSIEPHYYQYNFLDEIVTKRIFDLVTNDSAFIEKSRGSEIVIYDGLTYALEFQQDFGRKYCIFIPRRTNVIQGELHNIFKEMFNSYSFIPCYAFDLSDYEKNTNNQVHERDMDPPPTKKTIKFTPPIIQKEEQ
ncbi:MAG: hypothetical protein HXX09_11240 [Bacteroidetes bacterium]|nr:hypothetical protein [Bacteroidota bacterium]